MATSRVALVTFPRYVSAGTLGNTSLAAIWALVTSPSATGVQRSEAYVPETLDELEVGSTISKSLHVLDERL